MIGRIAEALWITFVICPISFLVLFLTSLLNLIAGDGAMFREGAELMQEVLDTVYLAWRSVFYE